MFSGVSLFARCGRIVKEDEEKVSEIPKGDDNACYGETIVNCDTDGGAWSDLTHHVLFMVMMQLGVIDFVAFSGVCKSWRSCAFSYMRPFMASRPPMFLLDDEGADVDWCCLLKDVEGRRFKTVVPHSGGKICLGLTCGYLIMFEFKPATFCLVNLITRHELHFPNAPVHLIGHANMRNVRAILVFSPSIVGGLVFVVLSKNTDQIWFSKGKGAWDHISSTIPMVDIQFFKGKIYTLHGRNVVGSKPKIIGVVLSLDPKESKITLLETRNSPIETHVMMCSDENIYLLQNAQVMFTIYKLDFDEMKWVVEDENVNMHAFFISYMSCSIAVKPESWWKAQFRIGAFDDLCGNEIFFKSGNDWYYPHQCRHINCMDE